MMETIGYQSGRETSPLGRVWYDGIGRLLNSSGSLESNLNQPAAPQKRCNSRDQKEGGWHILNRAGLQNGSLG